MSDTRPTHGLPAGGDQIVPGILKTIFQAAGTKRRRSALILLIGLVAVAVVVVGVGLLIISSTSHESQSYKDGYSVGGAVYASDSTAQLAPRQACEATEHRGAGHGGPPPGTDAAQWIKGCTAAFTTAQDGN